MKTILQLFIVCTFILPVISCRQTTPDSHAAQSINVRSLESSAPYLTTDNKGNAVLCWTSKDPVDSLNRLMYAVYNAEDDKFSQPVIVSVSAGTVPSEESMNKVAFKSDGTVLAVFAKRFESEKNPYAGAIFYSISSDEGKNWAPAQYLHSDTSHVYGRSFFDISTLRNGEVGAIWLDGRFGKAVKGSALFFSGTQYGGGFGKETCINKNTCECCRTELLADRRGYIHIAFRSIMYPPALMGKQVRDMVYAFSKDNGKTFTPVQVISKDHWAIEGCPHTGPSLAVTNKGIHAVWFTAGGGSGLYYSQASAPGADFKGRQLLTATGRHPQLVSLADGTLVLTCEEDAEVRREVQDNQNHSHGGMSQGSSSIGAKIILRVLNGAKKGRHINLTDGKHPDHHAVIIPLKGGLLAAWIREDKGKPTIYYTRVRYL